jgi:hypothetical protein
MEEPQVAIESNQSAASHWTNFITLRGIEYTLAQGANWTRNFICDGRW